MVRIVCIDCGKECKRTGNRQKRCSKCRRFNKLAGYRKRYREKVEEFAKQGLDYNHIHSHSYNSEYYKKHKKRIDLNNKRCYLKTRDVLRKQAFEVLADKKGITCIKHSEWGCCQNSSDLDILQIDHIEDDGATHRKKIGTGNTFYRWVINNPKEARKKLQILCANAQWKKRRIVEAKEREKFEL